MPVYPLGATSAPLKLTPAGTAGATVSESFVAVAPSGTMYLNFVIFGFPATQIGSPPPRNPSIALSAPGGPKTHVGLGVLNVAVPTETINPATNQPYNVTVTYAASSSSTSDIYQLVFHADPGYSLDGKSWQIEFTNADTAIAQVTFVVADSDVVLPWVSLPATPIVVASSTLAPVWIENFGTAPLQLNIPNDVQLGPITLRANTTTIPPGTADNLTLVFTEPAGPLAGGTYTFTITPADAAGHPNTLTVVVPDALVPVGGIVPWWRPNATIPIPFRFEICDGHQVTPDKHGFVGADGTPYAQPISLPDLRNAFVLGANPSHPDGATATAGDGPDNGPGVGGKGGSNTTRSTAHTHVVGLGHTHAALGTQGPSAELTQPGGGGQTSVVGDHAHTVTGGGTHIRWIDGQAGNHVFPSLTNPQNNWVPMLPDHSTNNAGAHAHSVAAHQHDMGHTHSVPPSSFAGSVTSGAADGANLNVTPRYVGLLWLMRVR